MSEEKQPSPAKLPPMSHGGDPSEIFLDYVRSRQREIAILLVVILGGAAVLAVWTSLSGKRQLAAQAGLGELLEDFENEARDPQAGHDACIEFAGDHGGAAADHARYLAALWLERAGSTEPAADEMQKLMDDLPKGSLLAGPVRSALARLLEEAGRPGDAADLHLAEIEDAGEEQPPEDVVLAAARTLAAADRVDEARSVLEAFIAGAGEGAPPATWARARLAMLAAGD